MKEIKMKICGVTLDNALFNPVIVLKSSNGKVFPVPIGSYDKNSIVGAFVHKKPIHSEIVAELLKTTGFKVKKVLLYKNNLKKAVAKVFLTGTKEKVFELSATAGILLCLETGKDILVSDDLFKDSSFYRNKLDEKKMMSDFERMFFDSMGSHDINDIVFPWKDTIQ